MIKPALASKHSSCIATMAASVLASSSAQALIIVNESGFTVQAGSNAVGWDIDATSTDEVVFDTFNSQIINLTSFNGLTGFGLRSTANDLLNIGYGAAVNDGFFKNSTIFSIFQFGDIYNASGFTSGETAYIGFTFQPDSTRLYGWAEVILTNDSQAGTFEVVRWAYDDTGADINAGTVPEPAETAVGLGALALGAAGLRRWRKSKKAAV